MIRWIHVALSVPLAMLAIVVGLTIGSTASAASYTDIRIIAGIATSRHHDVVIALRRRRGRQAAAPMGVHAGRLFLAAHGAQAFASCCSTHSRWGVVRGSRFGALTDAAWASHCRIGCGFGRVPRVHRVSVLPIVARAEVGVWMHRGAGGGRREVTS